MARETASSSPGHRRALEDLSAEAANLKGTKPPVYGWYEAWRDADDAVSEAVPGKIKALTQTTEFFAYLDTIDESDSDEEGDEEEDEEEDELAPAPVPI